MRSIVSPDAYHYIIQDQVELNSSDEVCFVLNTYGTIVKEREYYCIEDSGVKLLITPKNWKLVKEEYGIYGADGNGREVNRLCLYIGGSPEYLLITVVKIVKQP